MVYKFRSVFDRNNDYSIICDEPLELYDNFGLSIKKVDDEDKSFSYENIDCILKYSKKGVLGSKQYELDRDNFTGYHKMVETFKNKKLCLSMIEPIELIREGKTYECNNITLDNADTELKLAFEKYVKESGLMNTLFQVFLQGVTYGKRKGEH